MDLLNASAELLLATSLDELRRLWPRDVHLARRLLHRWHPDRNADPRATAVFAHLQAVRQAQARAHSPQEHRWTTQQGTFAFRYLRSIPTAVGQQWYGHRILVDTVLPDFVDLIPRAEQLQARLPFADADMRRQIEPMLPGKARHLPGIAGGPDLLVRARPAGMVRLAEVLIHEGGRLDPRHVGWIGSALWHLACYLEYAQVVHQNLDTTTVWIHPEDHRIAVLDPWLFATRAGQPLVALPPVAMNVAPRAYVDDKRAAPVLDQHLIRALLRQLLGDRTGMGLPSTVPAPLVQFVRLPPSGTALQQYAAWKAALMASFGKPTFVALAISPTTIDPED